LYHILYVDDEPGLLEIGKLFLEQSGQFSVDVITSAPAALALLNTKNYDAIISDYQMPRMDGIEFLKAVRTSGNIIPFILFTGRGREDIVIQALNEGADYYLQKGGEPVSQFAELAHQARQAVMHRQAEASIRDHERREQDIINFLPDATLAIDKKGIVIAWNRALEEMTGIPASQMLGKGDYEYAIPLYGERRPILIDLIFLSPDQIRNQYSDVVRDGTTLTAETTLPRLRGEPGTLWCKASLLYDRGGNVIGAIESMRDITERKSIEVELKKAHNVLEDRVNQRTADLYEANLQLQKEIETREQTDSALQESEERFRTLIEKAPEAILLFDMDLDRYVEVNAKAGQLFGCNCQQLLESGPQQFYLPDQFDGRPFRETVPEHRKQVLAGAELVFERSIRTARGENRIVEVRLVHLPSSTRKLIRSSFVDITERKRVEMALRESEERYRTIVEQDYRSILENIEDVFYRTDVKGNLILASPSGARLLGYAGPEEIIGKPATDFYADLAQREIFLAALKKDGSVSNMEITLKRADGFHVVVSTSSQIYYDASGNYAGVEGIFRDITRLKQVQEELRQSEEQNRVLIEHTQDGAFIMQDGFLQFCNGAFAAMIGYTPTEIIGTPVPNLIAPEDREVVMGRQRDRLLGKSLLESYEFRMIHKDAITRVLVILSVGIGTYRDRPAVIGTVRDVTREREREHALLESEGKYRSLVETSFDGIIIHQDGVIVYANRAAVRLIGVGSADEIMGKPILSFVHPDFRTTVLQRMESATAEIQPVIREKFLRTDGSSIDVDVVAIPFVWKDRPAVHVVFRNITGEIKAEETLQNANDLLNAVIESPAGVAIFALDQQYRYIAFNENHRRMMKQIWGVDIALGTSMLEYLQDPEDRAKATLNFNRALAGESFTVTEAYGDTNLERRWYENAYDPIMDKKGNVTGLTLFLTDVTDRKHAEDTLRDSEGRFRTLAESCPFVIAIYQGDYWVYTNPAGERISGYSADELYTMHYWDFVAPEFQSTVKEAGRKRQSRESVQKSYDLRIITKDKKEKWIELYGSPITFREKAAGLITIIDITDRKRAEQALRENEEKFRAIFDSTFHFTGLLTPDGIMLEANRTALDFAGVRLEDVVNRPFWETVWWGANVTRIRRLKEAIHKAARGIFVRYETEFVGAGNSTMTVDFSLKPVFDSTGRIRLLIAEARDITERKKAEDALRESEEKYRKIIENAPYGMHFYELKPEKGLVFTGANTGADEILGVRHDQFIGKTIEEAFPGLADTEVPARYREAAESGSVWHTEQVHYNKGSISGAYAVTAFQTAPGFMAAMFVDITSRKQTEDALRESEEKFRGIFDTINDGIHIHEITSDGKPGKFIEVNEAACQMLQYTREELLKHGPLDFVTEYHSRPFDDIIAELSTTGYSIFETGHRRKDGTIVPVEINSHVVNLQGKKVGVTMIRDITERKRTEDALRLANRQITLLTGVTRHDILNKVSTARGYLKIAEMKYGDPTQAEYLEKTDAAITAIKSQIEFTRVYQDLGTHEPQWIELDMVMPRAHVPKTISLNSDIQGVILFSDPMLEKVFFNLLDNSIRHGEHVTEIRVSSHPSAGNLVVVWEDNGIGIAADEKERIFERGFGKNTGLGLFLVREILSLTGITIAETGEPGKGARFEMMVPDGQYRLANPMKE